MVNKGTTDEATVSVSIVFSSTVEVAAIVQMEYKDRKRADTNETIKTFYTYANQTLTLKKTNDSMEKDVILKVDESAKTMTTRDISSNEILTLKLVK